jgi:molybdopterin/thiamine biosynthesis adenylyltransferase
MNDEQLLRYSRQIMLPSVGIEGQERLIGARVLVVGLGGLGSAVAMYLAAAGVGTLVVADFDTVDLSNLQRQILHTTERIGMPKVDSALEGLRALNPQVRIEGFQGSIESDSLPALLEGVDAVVDGCDNFATRFAVNAACFRASVPLISGAPEDLADPVTSAFIRVTASWTRPVRPMACSHPWWASSGVSRQPRR